MLYVKEFSRAAARSSTLYSESLLEFTFPKLAAVVDAGRPTWDKEKKELMEIMIANYYNLSHDAQTRKYCNTNSA